MRTNRLSSIKAPVFLFATLLLSTTWFMASAGYGSYDPTGQSEALIYDEAQTVYLGNLARQNEAGQPPLRWNQQLTHASRWFSWDSVENRATPYCATRTRWAAGPAIGHLYLVIWAVLAPRMHSVAT